MGKPHLTRVKVGVNKKTWDPIFYVEARINPKSPWRLIVNNGKWLTHRTEAAAEREATRLEKRLWAKLTLDVLAAMMTGAP